MAETTLADVIEPEIFLEYTAVNDPTKHQLVTSGVVTRNALLDGLVAQKNTEKPNLPFWLDLDQDDDANLSDDSDTLATPGQVTAEKMVGRVLWLNKTWRVADLVQERIGENPMARIKDRTSVYWTAQLRKRCSAVLRGILADNIANDSGDMVNDIHVATNAEVTDAARFSERAFINAAFTMGDMYNEMSVIYMHSIVYSRLVEQNDVVDVRASDGTLLFSTYKNHRIIVEDNDSLVTAAAGTGSGDAAPIYRTVVMSPGALGYGIAYPEIPVEVWREPISGNGAGKETYIERVNWIIHPFGYAWQESSIAAQSPSIAEMQEAAQWNRVVARKNVPIAFLISNG